MVKVTRAINPKHTVGERFQRALAFADKAQIPTEPLPDSMAAVEILQALNVDEDTLIAAYLGSTRFVGGVGLEEVEETFGATVAGLVKNVRWLNSFRPCRDEIRHEPGQAERLRRLLLAMVDDVRAVLIKLAWRLARLKMLDKATWEVRRCIARETLDIFAPLANRLGVAQLKWEMEDLAFRYLDPQTYKRIATGLEERRVDRERYLEDFKSSLRGLLEEGGVQADISGRPKHIYSIWRKMRRKGVGLADLFDIRALRVIVESLGDCYTALGLIHTHWKTIPREFDDYIANPKPNGYQSLHTVVIGPGAKPIEIQLRTRAMHEFAELGFAAHWRYKEGSRQDEALHHVVNSLRVLLEESDNDTALIEDFQTEAFPDRVFVLTPKGEVMELTRGATPLDFAYAIHTEVGHRCRGAKVDGRIVPLTRKLQNGEQVEILTAGEARPSRDWMNAGSGYLVSPNARAKVRYWFHQQDRGENIEAGSRILEQTIKRLGARPRSMTELLAHFRQPDEDSLLIAMGRGDIRQTQLDALFRPELPERPVPGKGGGRRVETGTDTRAEVAGVDNLLTRVARCCKPVPGDDVIGYITHGFGITVHRRDCANILNLPEEKRVRLIEIEWGSEAHFHSVELRIQAFDRPGLLNDITRIPDEDRANLLRVDTQTDPRTQGVQIKLSLQVRSAVHLTNIINKISQVRNVLEVQRSGER